MTTTAKPAAAIIETSRGPKLLECPYCGETELINAYEAHHRDFDVYECEYCESGGYMLDLPDAPEPVDLTIDDTHAIYGDIGPIIPPGLATRIEFRDRLRAEVRKTLTEFDEYMGRPAHCWGCDDQCKGINAGSNRPCPCKCH